jgi:DNA-binding transcriptional LysR family regulator
VLDLWTTLLADWLPTLRDKMPDTALQVETGTTDTLIRKLLDSVIDLAILFEPPQVPALELRELAVINLVLASTARADHGTGARLRLYHGGLGYCICIAPCTTLPEPAGPRIAHEQGILPDNTCNMSMAPPTCPNRC